MVVLTDDRIVGIFKKLFGLDESRMVYGTLQEAKVFWTRYNADLIDKGYPGVAIKPYMALKHTIRFFDDDRFTHKVAMVDAHNKFVESRCTRIWLDYVVELVDDKVIKQIEYIKSYMLWANEAGSISFKDGQGIQWDFKVVAENPEDNSDLEEEDEQGRTVRTTFTFAVESLLLEKSDSYGWITQALLKIHLYAGNDINDNTTLSFKTLSS